MRHEFYALIDRDRCKTKRQLRDVLYTGADVFGSLREAKKALREDFDLYEGDEQNVVKIVRITVESVS